MPRETIVQERVIGREELDDVAVLQEDAADERLRLGGEVMPELIGEVREQPAAAVLVTTPYGGNRLVDMLVGDPLPRIC